MLLTPANAGFFIYNVQLEVRLTIIMNTTEMALLRNK